MSGAWLVCKGLKYDKNWQKHVLYHQRNALEKLEKFRAHRHTLYARWLSTSGGFCDWYSCTICLWPSWDKSLDHLVSLEILGMFFRVAWKCSYYSIAIAGVPCDTLWILVISFDCWSCKHFSMDLGNSLCDGLLSWLCLMQLTQRVRKIHKWNRIADWPAHRL